MARCDERGQSHAGDGYLAAVKRWDRRGLMAAVGANSPGSSRRRLHLAPDASPGPMSVLVTELVPVPGLVFVLVFLSVMELGLTMVLELVLMSWCRRQGRATRLFR